jgi:hypothetical protein
MNKQLINISDQLLAKFLDGKTDAFETEQVLAYLNENNENLEDFLNIRSAIEIDSECPVEIDLRKRLDIVNQHIVSSDKKSNRNKFYLITSIAAAAVVVGVVFLFAFFNDKNDAHFVEKQENLEENLQNVLQDTIIEQMPIIQLDIDKKNFADSEPKKSESVETAASVEDEEIEIQVKKQQRRTAGKSVFEDDDKKHTDDADLTD